jgi:peptidoglycan/xylan/chitin deacetylase (PgdA/CDA1 family)
MLPTVDRATVWRNVPTTDDVAFICIDDGYFNGDPPEAAQYVEDNALPVTPFLTYYAASSGAYPPPTDPAGVAHIEYLRRFAGTRGVQCHAKTHADLRTLDYNGQVDQLSKGKSWLALTHMFGPKVPTILRPPYGYWNDDTRRAAFAVGFKVMVKWTHIYPEFSTKPVRPGDILLCHFDANLLDQLQAASLAISTAGLTPAYIADYVQ